MKLHLGVNNFPYGEKGSATTGEVAGYLEKDFGVMETFVAKNKTFIAESLEHGLAGELENMLMGRPVKANPFARSMDLIEHRFRDYITNEESGIQTKTKAVGSRFKRQYRQVPAKKISFVDTGNYRRSFRCWIK